MPLIKLDRLPFSSRRLFLTSAAVVDCNSGSDSPTLAPNVPLLPKRRKNGTDTMNMSYR